MLLDHAISQYHHYSNANIQDREMILQHFIALVHVCLLSLQKYAIPTEIKKKIYEIIDVHTRKYGV